MRFDFTWNREIVHDHVVTSGERGAVGGNTTHFVHYTEEVILHIDSHGSKSIDANSRVITKRTGRNGIVILANIANSC